MLFIIGVIFLTIGLCYIYWIAFHSPNDEVPSPKYCFEKSKVIWGLWHTGDWMMQLGLIEKYHSKIERLLLLDPYIPPFKEHVTRGIGTEADARDQIIKLTRLANSKRIKLKWYDKPQNNAVTLYDLDSEKAWCVMQEIKANVPRELRPKWKLLNKDSQFNGVVANFKDIWDKHSREPQPKEYEG